MQLRRKHLVLWVCMLRVLRIASHLLSLLRLHLLLALLLLVEVALLRCRGGRARHLRKLMLGLDRRWCL